MAFFMNSFKYLIFLINLIFFGLGLYMVYQTVQQLGQDVTKLDSALKSPIYVVLVIALVIVFISFIGCCGTCYENPCMIKTYAFLILVCCILQIAVVFMLYKIDPEEVSRGFKDNLIAKYDSQEISVKRSVQLLQEGYKCCGVSSYQDYKVDISKLPNSCCLKYEDSKFGQEDQQVGLCKDVTTLQDGCQPKLVELVQANSKSFLIAIGCVFGFQILVVILSCVLSKSIREQYNVV